jgi:hypothetical protein
MLNYIYKNQENLLVIQQENSLDYYDTTFQKYLNGLLSKELTNIYAREISTKKLLNYKSKIPIYVNKRILLMCIRSYRLENSFYINYHSILSYTTLKDCIILTFLDNHCLKIHEKQIFINQLNKCREIINYLEF